MKNFILIWETAEDAEQAHRMMTDFCRTGGHPPIPKPIMIARAAKYRAAGTQLRKFRPGLPPASETAADMNAYIAEIRRQMQAGTVPTPAPVPPRPARPAVDQDQVREAVKEMLAKLQSKKA